MFRLFGLLLVGLVLAGCQTGNTINVSTNGHVCDRATNEGEWSTERLRWVKEAKRRGLSCGVGVSSDTQVVSSHNKFGCYYLRDLNACSTKMLCDRATIIRASGIEWDIYGIDDNFRTNEIYYQEAKRRGLSCGVGETSTTQTASSNTTTQSKTQTSAELTAAQKEAERLRQELTALKAEQEQQQ